jgi:hypothetical protein
MLSETELLALFASSEIDSLDFKRDIPDLTDKTKLPEFIKDIIAIANSVFAKEAKRGYLIFGVENKTREPRNISGQIANHKNETISANSHTQIEINELNQKEFIRIIKEYVRGFYGDLIVNYFCYPNPKSPEKLSGILEVIAIHGPFMANKETYKYDPKTGQTIGTEFRKGQSWIRNGEDKRELYPDELFQLAHSKISLQAKLGSVAQIVSFNNMPTANEETVRRYYEGHPLGWGVILAHGDVERDVTPSIKESLDKKDGESRIFCIIGEAGAGKSTLAWRLAHDYSTKENIPLIRVLDSDSPEIWYQIENASLAYREHLIVLVDDVFRSEAATRALSTIGENSNITIIATSRQNEIPRDVRIQIPLKIYRLQKPSSNEVSLALEKLKLRPEKLEPGFLSKIRQSPSWLVMMYVLTKGDDLQKILRSSIEQLRKQDEVVYRAFEYIVFSGQYELSFPETLLLNLDEKGSFYKIRERASSQGIIFRTFRPGFLRSLHSLIAKEALRVYQRDPFAVIEELISAINPEDYFHRLFIFSLMDRFYAANRLGKIVILINKWSEKFDNIIRNSSISELSTNHIHLFQKINDQERLKQVELLILEKAPETASDWVVIAGLAINSASKENGQKTIKNVSVWLQDNDNSHVRSLYLQLISKFGDKYQIWQLIDASHEWLQNNPERTDYRQRYLNLVSEHGAKEQIQRSIVDTSEWLEKFPAAKNVRQKFLTLIAKHGQRNQINRFIDETLKSYKTELMLEDFVIPNAFLALVNRKGSPGQIREVVNISRRWLEYHPDDAEIRKTIIGIVKEKDDVASVGEIINEAFVWLRTNFDNTSLRPALLSLTAYKGTSDQVAAIKQETKEFLKKYPQKVDVQIGYCELIEIRGLMDEKKRLLLEIIELIKLYPKSTKMRIKTMQLAKRIGTKEQLSFLIEFNKAWESEIADPTFSSVYKSLIQEYNRSRKNN